MNQTKAARRLDVRNPRTGEIDYHFNAPEGSEIEEIIQGLRNNQAAWSAAGLEQRIAVFKKWQAALMQEKDAIVAALALDTGRKTLAEQEFYGLLGSIDRWCKTAPKLMTHSSQPSVAMPKVEIFSDSEPYSVLAAISPWNFPLLLSFIDTTPALLAGCSAIIKPSEVTPRFAEPVARAIAAVPEMAKVLAIVPGDGETGQTMIRNADVVAFTGSVATGKKVAAAAAESFIPAFLELGGKDPVVILPGSDLDRASTSILRASVSATGQACQSLERIYVSEGECERFTKLLIKKSQQVELSKDDPDRGAIGPLIFARQAEIIADHIADALAKGATVECGGEIIEQNGSFWIEPTVLSNVDHEMKVMTEETFGPVMPIMSYREVDQAIALANDTIYGLSAAVFGPDDESALAVAQRINAGGVSVNDAGMTSMVFETEKSAFGYSGMGPSRVGAGGLTRFLRQKSLYVNRGPVTPISAFAERKDGE